MVLIDLTQMFAERHSTPALAFNIATLSNTTHLRFHVCFFLALCCPNTFLSFHLLSNVSNPAVKATGHDPVFEKITVILNSR